MNKKPSVFIKEKTKTSTSDNSAAVRSSPHDVIKYPVSGEKTIRLMEATNTLIFVVNRTSTKKDIKEAVQEAFKAKVNKVNTHITPDGEKRAFVTFAKDSPAIDVATTLGMI